MLLMLCQVTQIQASCVAPAITVLGAVPGGYSNPSDVPNNVVSGTLMNNVETTLFSTGTGCSTSLKCTLLQTACTGSLTSAQATYA